MNTNRIAPIPHSMSFWRGIAALEALLLVGGAYGTVRQAPRNPNVPISGTGSAYDGQ